VRQLEAIQGLMEKTGALGLGESESDAVRASAAEFILEGLYAHKRLSRSEEKGFSGEDRRAPREPREFRDDDDRRRDRERERRKRQFN
jgi:magnesium chelatase subunit I